MAPAAEHPSRTLFQLAVHGRPEPLRVASFRGREEISAPYRVEVQITAAGAGDDLGAALLGKRVSLLFLGDGEIVRALHGMAVAVESQGAFLRDREGFVVTVAPRLARLRRRRTRRIFQHQSSVDIASRLFEEHSVPFRVAAHVKAHPRAYTVQYDETDHAFLTRLFAEDGLFYFFEHPLAAGAAEPEIVVIGGAAGDYVPIPGDPRLRFERHAGEGALQAEERQIGWFVAKDRVRSRRTRVRGYDFRRPDIDIHDEGEAAGSMPVDLDSLYDHTGSFEENTALPSARTRLEQERRKALTAEGKCACRRLVPGHVLTLEGHDLPALDRDWRVSRVDHEGHSGETVPAGRALYESRFRCAPADVPPRPRFAPPKPRQVAETAVVVGPPGEEIHTDEHGRIRVQFQWDLEGRRDEHSSCWLRVAHAWADAGWGAQFIPRVGSEVVVTYLGGDVDRPLVTGSVYNATHPHPFPVPEHRTRSGFRTRSTPLGDGGNELSFEDARGREEIFVRAEKDYREMVRNDRTSRVERNSHAEIGGEAQERVAKNASLRVGIDRTGWVGKDDVLAVGGRSETAIAGDRALEVRGSESVTVHGRAVTEVRGDRAVIVGSGTAPAQSEQVVHGPLTLASTAVATVRATEGLRLVCGESVIELTPEKIVMKARAVEVTPKDTLECGTKDGPTMTIGDDVEILASKLRVFTEGGALEMDNDFKANGASIKLGYSPDKPSRETSEEDPETKPFSCKLSSYFLKPFVHKTYHLLTEGLRFEGETDGEGVVKAEIPKRARVVTVRLWLDVYPEGRQRLFTFTITEKPPGKDVLGAKRRLANLGYDVGPLDAEPSPQFHEALAEFQSDHRDTHGLEPTGELDEGTMGALEEVHGH